MTEKFEEAFARLYCREKGIEPDDCWSDYADLGNCSSYVSITWEIKGKRYEKQIKVKEALDLMSEHSLRLEERLKNAEAHLVQYR
jgi:hypothetical protein